MICCEKCRRVLPLTGRLANKFSGNVAAIISALQRAGAGGLSTSDLFDAVYGHDPDGGPLSGFKIISASISQIQVDGRLRRFGYDIVNISKFGGPGCTAKYRLVELHVPTPDRASSNQHDGAAHV